MRGVPSIASAVLCAASAAVLVVAAEAAEPLAVLPSARGGAVVAVTAEGGLAWRVPLEARPIGVATVGTRVVVSLPSAVAALDRATGTPVWRVALEGRPTAPAALGTLAVVGTSASRLVAVDVETGATAWTLDAGGPVSGTPAAEGDLVVAATRQRDVMAVTADGRPRWRVAVSGRVTARTAAAPDVVYIAALDGRLTGLDLETGRTRVVAPLSGPVDEGLVVDRAEGGRDLVAALLEDGTVVGLAVVGAPSAEPRVAWTFAAGAETPEPVAAAGRVFLGGRDVVALDAATGRVLWRLTETLARGFGRELTRRLVERERGLTPEEVRAARAASPYELRGAVSRPPMAVGSLLLLATDEGFLYAVDAATGELRWRVAEGD